MPEGEEKPKNYLDVLKGETNALSERFGLTKEQAELLRTFVIDKCLTAWRNGRAIGSESVINRMTVDNS
jgi:hypothetical protein